MSVCFLPPIAVDVNKISRLWYCELVFTIDINVNRRFGEQGLEFSADAGKIHHL